MLVAEPLVDTWKANLELEYAFQDGKTLLGRRFHDGPLVVQKPLYPEGGEVCHTIIVHPPGGIAGGDELTLNVEAKQQASALLTTPGATKWYRSGGPWARQRISLGIQGSVEWLPRETIVFDGTLAYSAFAADLAADAVLIGWDLVCLGRTGSGERFSRGIYRFSLELRRAGRTLWLERGRIEGGSRLLESPPGLAQQPVFGTLFASAPQLDAGLAARLRREQQPRRGEGSITQLPGVLLARYLGDSSEDAHRWFVALWRVLRPALCGREAIEPRIWGT
jgi:urease accessory protein